MLGGALLLPALGAAWLVDRGRRLRRGLDRVEILPTGRREKIERS